MPIVTLNNLSLCSFYDKKDTPYYSLANYSAHPVKIYDMLLKQTITWPTTEHYFQAQKIADKNARAKFVNDTQNQGPDYCRKNVDKYQPHDLNWHNGNTKQDVMRTALFAKYNQHADVKQLVDSTGKMPIVEDTAGASYVDDVWGCGYSGNGENWLGRLWMEVRAQARDGQSPAAATLEADTLHQQAKTELGKLGTRKQVLLQNHPKVTLSSGSTTMPQKATLKRKNTTGVTDFISLANKLEPTLIRGENHTITAKDGTVITYGKSGAHGTFYVKGQGHSGAKYDVYIDAKNKVFENGQFTTASKWADWAANQVSKALSLNSNRQYIPSKKPYNSSFSGQGGSDFVSLANQLKPTMNATGEKHFIIARDGSKITYGVSKAHGTFYVKGQGHGGANYYAYIDAKNNVFENGNFTTASKWADWAAKEVSKALSPSNRNKFKF